MRKILKTLLAILIVGGMGIVSLPATSSAVTFRSPISVTIKMKKKVFKRIEPIEGEVILNNYTMASIPAIFEVKLYRQGELKYQSLWSVQAVFTGTTKFSLRDLQIPPFPGAPGRWHLSILQQNLPPSKAGRASFKIVQSEERTFDVPEK